MRTVSRPPPGLRKLRKIRPIATPLIRYGKNRMPFHRFLNRILNDRIVAKYSASAICTNEATK